MTIKDLKKELGLTNKELAWFFDMKPSVFANSTAKKRYEEALIKFYLWINLDKEEKLSPEK